MAILPSVVMCNVTYNLSHLIDWLLPLMDDLVTFYYPKEPGKIFFYGRVESKHTIKYNYFPSVFRGKSQVRYFVQHLLTFLFADLGSSSSSIVSHFFPFPFCDFWNINASMFYCRSQTQSKITKLRNQNQRPRGLDALLGHLLVKRIPVTFQLNNTKIPEYLSQK